MKQFIKEIKKYGCKIAIDDFGSGYSNFSHIFELNVDYIKIDSSLVKFVTTDENSRIIVKTIINFASNLGLKTIAEYVEDKDSLDLLEKMGVDFVQGYYICKPSKGLCERF
jgi:EAL domain-containing protein (putative c-di-GMP-specific phosphodiesterase class I)